MPGERRAKDAMQGCGSSFSDRRHAARFAAIQALYELDQSAAPNLSAVLRDFVLFRAREDLEGLRLGKFDRNLFQELVAQVWEEREDLDDMVSAVLPPDWNLERIDPVLKAILRSGICELANKLDLPKAVVNAEYVALAHHFFEGSEPKIVNAALETIAATLRDGEAFPL